MGFSNFRDPNESYRTNGTSTGKKKHSDVDSDDEEVDVKKEIFIKTEGDDVPDNNGMLSPEDAKHQAELAQGVRKIQVSKGSKMMYGRLLTGI